MGRDRHGETYQRVVRQMGSDGWMGVGWPKEYGGHGLGEVEQQIFANEAPARRRAPAGGHAPDRRADPDPLRHRRSRRSCSSSGSSTGDVHFAIGYSEPDAGTDLASLRTTAPP